MKKTILYCLISVIFFTPLSRAFSASLITAYGFEEASGTKIIDNSLNLNNGSSVSATYVNGKFGKALNLNGTANSYIITNPIKAMPSSAFTLEFWMQASDTINAGVPISYAIAGSDNELRLSNYKNVALELKSSLSSGDTGITLNDGLWHHVALTWQNSDGKMILYKDANQVWSGNLGAGTTLTPDGSFVIGQDQDTVAGGFEDRQAFKGNFDEFRLYDYVLTPSQISIDKDKPIAAATSTGGTGTTTATSTTPTPFNGITGYSFDEGSSTVIKDITGNNNSLLSGGNWVNGKYLKAINLLGNSSSFAIANNMKNFPTTALTVAFWAQTSDTNNAGVPFSYAVGASDNELRISNYKNLDVEVKSSDSTGSTGVSINDGLWHHLAVTWQNTDGKVVLYKDGNQVYTGNIGKARALDQGGTLVIGQDQDVVAGGFEDRQAFKGGIDDLRIYDRVLTQTDIVSAMNSSLGSSTATTSTSTPTLPPKKVAVVVLENSDYNDIIGSSSMPYLNSLISSGGLAKNYYANTHPSIGNYFMMTTGQVITNDSLYNATVTANNIIRELNSAGKKWKSYNESIPSVGYIGGEVYPYASRHNPMSYFSDVRGSSTQRNNIVGINQLVTDINSNSIPDYSYIIPNLINDLHDGTGKQADDWLKTYIDPLLKNSDFANTGILIITFDEANLDNTNGGGRIPFIIVGGGAKKAYQSNTFYQHQSSLSLTLEYLGITGASHLPGASATATKMTEFLNN